MRKEYEDELNVLRLKMESAEIFAKKVPVFADIILKNKYTGTEEYRDYVDYYKNLYLCSGIFRTHYTTEKDNITNYKGKYDAYLFHVYINTLSEYDAMQNYGLDDVCKKVPVFFYDALNKTFYATDEQISGLLDALVEWKTNAVIQERERLKVKEIEELQYRLAKLTRVK